MAKDEVLTETDDEIEVVEVDAPSGEEAKASEEAAGAAAATEEKKDDESGSEDDDDHEDDHDGEDSRLAESDDPDDAEEAKRKRKLGQRQRQKFAKQRAEQELAFLRTKVAELEAGQQQLRTESASTTQATIEARLAEVRKDVATADAILAQAIRDSDGDSYASAMRLRDEAKEQERELTAAQTAFKSRATEDSGAPDPAMVSFADQWKRANASWYGIDQRATDMANIIDAGVLRDGYDPKSREYWAELTRRTAAHFAAGKTNGAERRKEPAVDQETARRKPPPLGGTRDGNGQGGKRQVYLSRERVEAIKAAGAWDDPKERAEYIKAYETYDRDNTASR